MTQNQAKLCLRQKAGQATMTTCRIVCMALTMALALFTQTPNTAEAKGDIEIKAWQLHHLDMDYCKRVMDVAEDYDINTIVLSHDIIGFTMQLYGKSFVTPADADRGAKIRELANYAKDKNLKVWIWTHELADVPEKYVENDIVQMDRRGFWKWLEDRYDKVFVDFPEFDKGSDPIAVQNLKIPPFKIVALPVPALKILRIE